MKINWCVATLCFLALLLHAHEEEEEYDPCNPKHCQATFENVFSIPVTLPCSSASGEVIEGTHLPLLYPGDYDQCQRVYSFAGGHYCTIDTDNFIAIPLKHGITKFTGEALPLGRLHIGKCVSKDCTADLLKKSFLKGVSETARKIMLRKPLSFEIPFIRETIENSTKVRCVDEDETKRGTIWDRSGSVAMILLTVLLTIFVIVSSSLDLYFHSKGIEKRERSLINSFSVLRNIHALFSPMSGDFLAFNGIRVISILWIVSKTDRGIILTNIFSRFMVMWCCILQVWHYHFR